VCAKRAQRQYLSQLEKQMKLSIPEENIKLYETGFDETDFLDRKPFADKLSELIDKFETPFVVALDGPWGSGKSFFLKRWVGHHQVKAQDTVVVYLDAFALDYLDEPLVALVSEISARFEKQLPKSAKIWQSGKKIAAKLLPSVIRVAAAVATSGASELMARPFQVAVEKAAKEIDSAKLWEREHSRREAVTDFREFLESLTKGVDDLPAKKIVVVIDELDRCRPDYALSMLEIIKHFFDVSNVHFILGVNLAELENMARARYGEKLDARNYIGKFVKVNIRLPEFSQNTNVIAWEPFFDETAQAMGLKGAVLAEIKFQLKMLRSEIVTLRTIQRLLTSAALLPNFNELRFDSAYYKVLYCSLFLFNFFGVKKSSSNQITFDQIQLLFDLTYKDVVSDSKDVYRNNIYGFLAYALDANEFSNISDDDKKK
jgi:hypothetical protein